MPRPRSPHWFTLGLVFSILLTSLYFAVFLPVLNSVPTWPNLLGVLLIFFVISQLIALGGFFGLRLYPPLATVGLILGLVFFRITLGKSSGGFEDIVGFLSFFVITALGFATGLAAELANYLVKSLKKGKN